MLFTLQKRLRDFKRAGVEWVIIETSSHSLAQNRVWGIPFQIAVMTNVTNDHLDYHGTFRNYLQAKVRLFKIAARHGQKFGVINADDENAKLFEEAIPNFVSLWNKGGRSKATTIKPTAVNTNYQAMIDNEKYDITVKYPW
jgi:UDP-N-acetylmuramyl tripeptide synthase